MKLGTLVMLGVVLFAVFGAVSFVVQSSPTADSGSVYGGDGFVASSVGFCTSGTNGCENEQDPPPP